MKNKIKVRDVYRKVSPTISRLPKKVKIIGALGIIYFSGLVVDRFIQWTVSSPLAPGVICDPIRGDGITDLENGEFFDLDLSGADLFEWEEVEIRCLVAGNDKVEIDIPLWKVHGDFPDAGFRENVKQRDQDPPPAYVEVLNERFRIKWNYLVDRPTFIDEQTGKRRTYFWIQKGN